MYCSREKSNVALTGTPDEDGASMAGSPSGVPGDLDEEVGRHGAPMQIAGGTGVSIRVMGQKG
jgi:hypothetical protein